MSASEIKAIIERFVASRPVFALTCDGDEISIKKTIHKANPIPLDPKNALEALVCSKFSERFDIDCETFLIEKVWIEDKVMGELKSIVTTFLRNNLEMRNPTQSKLYRWYRQAPMSNQELNNGLVMMYKYLSSICLPAGSWIGSDPKHTANAIALLQAIMEKYEQ